MIELIAPCNFGLEALLSREIKKLGYEVTRVEDGRITFSADEYGICRASLWLRTAERLMVKMGEFEARSFEELFQNTKKLPWVDWIPKDAEFPVKKATSLKSTLYSTPDIQAIVKKAVVESLKQKYRIERFPENGPLYPITVFINKDRVTVSIDTSGESLHKRGYREEAGIAPIKETLAAGMVYITPWKADRVLIDPFCGAGTILVEAAMIALNKAPGLNRRFLAEKWGRIPEKLWRDARDEARDLEKKDVKLDIQGYDIDEHVLRTARKNAGTAGVSGHIHFQKRDVKELSSKAKYGFIITNPPYGERLEDRKAVEKIYKEMGKAFFGLDTWSFYIITSHEEFEKHFGRKADKKRKLYNGMIKTDLYQYFGPKPPRSGISE